MPSRSEVIRNLAVQADVCEDLEAAWKRALEQRDSDIYIALTMGISERTVAAATRLSRSFINKVRRLHAYRAAA